ncbi:chemotaxis-specific protein-glutamate methyltransferase CheB [Thermospira aquatica]|uniref:Protein-glutamate methylesterase/protein-glutamine glutaminase n=1 Tax=Thermospira aquatica TaxID=2828656 RepID=A0AAX3BB29_9SPIR|nr:chemotaxis-specific protein-glutamate methyltransferase CheB [Thermospira aquatica]URA09517.1 chemotaxis-specific protein-glutamate methyltransferase CheB [Thermospira aquatica]
MSNRKIRVLIIDDSVLIRKYVTQILSEINDVEVVGSAPNGKIGLQKIFLYKPDVVILDIEMPEMNGLEVLQYLKDKVETKNRPHVIVFSSVVGDGSPTTWEALSLGAKEIMLKPDSPIYQNLEEVKKEFQLKIEGLFYQLGTSKSEVKPVEKEEDRLLEGVRTSLVGVKEVMKQKPIVPRLVAIGSSTGGPNAIRSIMEHLGELSVPMVIAQHMPPLFTGEFAKNLSLAYRRPVKELTEGEKLQPGFIYVCPGGTHARIDKDGDDLVFHRDEKNYEEFFFKPSVDIFFKSIKEAVGNRVVAVVLSGMGKDGSLEAPSLRKLGAIVLAQDKATSVVWGMPGNAVKSGGVDVVLPIHEMGQAITMLAGKKDV